MTRAFGRFLCTFVLILGVGPAGAATFTVTKTDDTFDGTCDADCSLREAIEAWALQRTARECQETLMAAGVPCARYATVEDVLDDPHLNARGSFTTLDDGTGTFVVNNAPFRFRDSDTSISGGAPKLGQHTRSILTNVLGLDPQQLQALTADRIVS